jgi:hypothetical protein
MKLTQDQIQEIAQELDCGMKCFYNLKTDEILAIPDLDNCLDIPDELAIEEYNKLYDNQNDYFEFQEFESRDFFNIMADFVKSLDNTKLQAKLINA